MDKYTQMQRLQDLPVPTPMRMDYTQVLDKLLYIGEAEWTFVTYSPSTRVAERLKRAAEDRPEFGWEYTLEVFTRKMRPNKNGSPGYEIWARASKVQNSPGDSKSAGAR